REQGPGPVLLHLNGRLEDLERTRGQRAFHDVAKDLRGDVVEVRFQHGHGVALPVVRRLTAAPDGPDLAHDRANHIRSRAIVARAEAVAHLARNKPREWSEAFRELSENGGACGRDEFMRFLA